MNKSIETRSFCIIYDQRAEGDAALQEGVDRIRGLGHIVFLKKIDEPIDATRYASEASEQGADTVVAVGGDGMLNLVANGILQGRKDARCAVGLVPFGTGNDFAGASGIPLNDSLGALDVIIRATPVPIDVGRVNDTYFINVVTGGFPAEAAAETPGISKEFLGGFAYFLTGLAKIGSLAARNVRFTGPGFEWKGESYAFSFGNGRRAGGGFKVSPHARINDGLMDLMIVPESEEGLLPLIREFARVSNLGSTEKIVYVQVPWIDLDSPETIHLNVDGEPVKGRNFHFKIHPLKLPFHLPENSPVLCLPHERVDVSK
ncbi:MAG: YegS/Rv2252/BmrU family lipid kinase [Desulfobacteraceae bacterium]|nr:MAG: YegS/Rv2252/BmrU family lipid kinase [Desulfobacteraceae bacterium]